MATKKSNPATAPYLDRLDSYLRTPDSRTVKTSGSWLKDWVHGLEHGSVRLRGYARTLTDSDLNISPIEWFGVELAVAVCAGILLALALRTWYVIPLGLPIAYFGGGWYVARRRDRRQTRFRAQLGEALVLLAATLRSGRSFDECMQQVAEQCEAPLKTEFQRYLVEVGIGIPRQQAMDNLLRRNPSTELMLAIRGMRMQLQTGGNLLLILKGITETIRTRVRLEAEVRALTAQVRLSGYVLGVLPIGLALIIYTINPTYFAPMVKTTAGLVVDAIMLCMMGFGFYFMRRVARIRF